VFKKVIKICTYYESFMKIKHEFHTFTQQLYVKGKWRRVLDFGDLGGNSQKCM
jgi:hypothetical protein